MTEKEEMERRSTERKKEREKNLYPGTGAEGGVCKLRPATMRQKPAVNPPTETRASTEESRRSSRGRRGAAGAKEAGGLASGIFVFFVWSRGREKVEK